MLLVFAAVIFRVPESSRGLAVIGATDEQALAVKVKVAIALPRSALPGQLLSEFSLTMSKGAEFEKKICCMLV